MTPKNKNSQLIFSSAMRVAEILHSCGITFEKIKDKTVLESIQDVLDSISPENYLILLKYFNIDYQSKTRFEVISDFGDALILNNIGKLLKNYEEMINGIS